MPYALAVKELDLGEDALSARIQYELVPRDSWRFAWAVARATTATSPLIVVFCCAAAIAIVLGLLGAPPFGPGWYFVALGLVVFYVALVGFTVRQGRVLNDSTTPAGTVLSAQFGTVEFWIRSPSGEAIMRYDAYDRVWISSGCLLFRMRGGGLGNLMPLELLPDPETLQYIRSQLAPRR